jgi:hypothetical protein
MNCLRGAMRVRPGHGVLLAGVQQNDGKKKREVQGAPRQVGEVGGVYQQVAALAPRAVQAPNLFCPVGNIQYNKCTDAVFYQILCTIWYLLQFSLCQVRPLAGQLHVHVGLSLRRKTKYYRIIMCYRWLGNRGLSQFGLMTCNDSFHWGVSS